MNVDFCGYRCTCENLKTPPLTYRRDTFTCVVRNYIAYLKSRNLTNYVDTRKLERLMAFSDDNDKFDITWSRTMGEISLERSSNVVLCLFSPLCHTTIARLVDTQCCLEFIGFVKRHVGANIATNEIRASNEFLKFVAPKKF